MVEDVDIDGNPRGGIRVTAEAAPASSTDEGPGRFEALMERIVDDLRQNGDAASKTALAERVSGRLQPKFGAIDQLVHDGRIVVDGKVHRLGAQV